jgi:hypothetical protein
MSAVLASDGRVGVARNPDEMPRYSMHRHSAGAAPGVACECGGMSGTPHTKARSSYSNSRARLIAPPHYISGLEKGAELWYSLDPGFTPMVSGANDSPLPDQEMDHASIHSERSLDCQRGLNDLVDRGSPGRCRRAY